MTRLTSRIRPVTGPSGVHTHHVLVLDAGYAGLAAAKRLGRQVRGTGVRVTLVNRGDRFVERIRLHQLAAGQQLRDLPLDDMLAGSGVGLVVATVTALDLRRRTVRLDRAPHELGYDTLVYALGSSAAEVDGVPGAREHSLTVADEDGALRVRDRVAGLRPGSRVAVVGGGLTGLEVVTELAQARPDLRLELVTDGPLGEWLCGRARRHLAAALARLRIDVHDGCAATAVTADGVEHAGGDVLPADAVVWAAGFRVPGLAREAGLAVDARGRLVVDAGLRSVSHADVLGIGDAAAAAGPGERETRMACQTGLPMGVFAADAIARGLRGENVDARGVRYVWQNISLGRDDGITQFTRADDTPVNAVLTGRTAAAFKETISRSTVVMLRRPAVVTALAAASGAGGRRRR